MKRRNFIKKGALTGSFLALGGWGIDRLSAKRTKVFKAPFRYDYAPYPGMFERLVGKDPVDQLLFMAEHGFTAFEDCGMRLRPIGEQIRIAEVIRNRKMRAGTFLAHTVYWTQPNLTSGKREWRNEFLTEIRTSAAVAKRINAKWMSVITGYSDSRLDRNEQTANVVESLKQAAAILEPEGLVMVLEPLNFENDPGLFLSNSAQAYEICRLVNSFSCKFFYDLSIRNQTRSTSLTNLDAWWDEIACLQIRDKPESEGSVNAEAGYNDIFSFIKNRGYTGIIGITQSNPIYGKAEVQSLLNTCKSYDGLLS